MGGYFSTNQFPTPQEVEQLYRRRIITEEDIRKALITEFKNEARNSGYPDRIHVSVYGIIHYCREEVKNRGVKEWALLLDEQGNCLDGQKDHRRVEVIYNTIVQKFPDIIPGWRINHEESIGAQSKIVYQPN